MLRQVIDIFELLDRPDANARAVENYIRDAGQCETSITRVTGAKGATDFLRVTIPGTEGKLAGGNQPTLGIIGRLGGLGARPDAIGFVSDGDGALAAMAAAAKLSQMSDYGDRLRGDVVVSTHICPDAPTRPHTPVPFMDSPIDPVQVNEAEVSDQVDAILSIDTTKGNRIVNARGIAITPTVKEGYILKVSGDILDVLAMASGRAPVVLPLSQQDITPYGNDLYHVNSILQPSTATDAPVIGVAVVTESIVPGCATGATHLHDVELAARFCVEVAKAHTGGGCRFYDEQEFEKIQKYYGSMAHFQTLGCRP